MWHGHVVASANGEQILLEAHLEANVLRIGELEDVCPRCSAYVAITVVVILDV